MAPDKPHLPLERHDGFRNPQNVKVETWDRIKPIAERVFQVFHEEIPDFDWAEKAWRIAEKTPLARYSDDFERLRVKIRLFAIAELLHLYGHFSGIELYDCHLKYWEWVNACGLSRFKLALMCGEKYWEDRFVVSEWGDWPECVDLLVGEEYSRTVDVLQRGFGGNNQMLQSLFNSIGARDTEGKIVCGIRELQGSDEFNSNQVAQVMTWQHAGWPRHGGGSV